jgi:molybdopterin molybdotransferase
MIGFDDAQRAVLELCAPLGSEIVALADAQARIAGEDVVAEAYLVPFARSAMDGYAVRAVDTLGASGERPARLPVAQAIYAELGEARHAPGTASEIATGAPMPHGADAVIPFEDVARDVSSIAVHEPVLVDDHVFPPGEDAKPGDVIIRAGRTIGAAAIGILAADGRAQVRTFRRPRLGIVCTGDELVAVEATPKRGQIRNSNAPMIAALARECGADVRLSVTVRDRPEDLRTVFAQTLGEVDVLVTTGGASVGTRDYVKGTLAELGVDFAFTAVAMRPSKPTAFGRRGATRVAVLPGNPAAAYVAFLELVRPAVLALGGCAEVLYPAIPAALVGTINGKAQRTYIAFGELTHDGAGLSVVPLVNQCSSIVRTAADANCLIVVPPGEAALRHGDQVTVHVLDWSAVHDNAYRNGTRWPRSSTRQSKPGFAYG